MGGTIRLLVGMRNGNVVRRLGERLGMERDDAVWAVAESWAGSTLEEGDILRVQLGESAAEDLWEAVDLLLGVPP